MVRYRHYTFTAAGCLPQAPTYFFPVAIYGEWDHDPLTNTISGYLQFRNAVSFPPWAHITSYTPSNIKYMGEGHVLKSFFFGTPNLPKIPIPKPLPPPVVVHVPRYDPKYEAFIAQTAEVTNPTVRLLAKRQRKLDKVKESRKRTHVELVDTFDVLSDPPGQLDPDLGHSSPIGQINSDL